jgi:cathepsin X
MLHIIASIGVGSFLAVGAHAADPTRTSPVFTGEIKLKGDFPDVIKSPQPGSYISDENVPSSWDWRKLNMLTTDLNQHIPVYCGSCWAHASTSTLADRMKIGSNATLRDVMPSIQVLLNCGTAGSCGGGDIHAVFRWIYLNGIPDVTCQQYLAVDGTCTDMEICKNCDHDPNVGCSAVKNYPKYTISEYGRVIGDS